MPRFTKHEHEIIEHVIQSEMEDEKRSQERAEEIAYGHVQELRKKHHGKLY